MSQIFGGISRWVFVLVFMGVFLTPFTVQQKQRKTRVPVKLTKSIKIIPTKFRRNNDTAGISNGVQQCGGTGQVVEWRIGSCDPSIPGPCRVKAGQSEDPDLAFIPSRNSTLLGVVGVVTIKDEQEEPFKFHNEAINQVPVIAGEKYSITAGVIHKSYLRGKVISTQLTIYNAVDKQVEVCASVDWLIL